jgi:hypothetical protein
VKKGEAVIGGHERDVIVTDEKSFRLGRWWWW